MPSLPLLLPLLLPLSPLLPFPPPLLLLLLLPHLVAGLLLLLVVHHSWIERSERRGLALRLPPPRAVPCRRRGAE